MPSRYPVGVRKQVVELARAGTRVAQLAETFGMSEAVIYGWLKQERIDRGEAPGLSTEGQMELAAAKRRIRQLETELAVSRRSTRYSSSRACPQKPLPGDCLPDRAGV
jgi:transposase